MNQADLEIYRAELFAKYGDESFENVMPNFWKSETEFHKVQIAATIKAMESFENGALIKLTESDELTEQEKLTAAYNAIVKEYHDHRAMAKRSES